MYEKVPRQFGTSYKPDLFPKLNERHYLEIGWDSDNGKKIWVIVEKFHEEIRKATK